MEYDQAHFSMLNNDESKIKANTSNDLSVIASAKSAEN